MDDEIRIETIVGDINLEDNIDQVNINVEEGLPGKDAKINGVNALMINGGTNLTITQEGNVATLDVDFSGIEQDKTYVHEQVTASAQWSVVHNLGKHPAVTVIDSGETAVIGDIEYISLDEITITFGSPFGGKAFLN